MNLLQFRHRRMIASSGALGAIMLMAGCASLPPKVQLSTPKPAGRYDMSVSLTAPSRSWPDDHWWSSYGDAQLSSLIEKALADAPDLKVAMARIRRSDAIASQAGASLLPGIDAIASVRETRQSYNLGMPSPRGWNDAGRATLDFSWELDFWGRNRAALAAATSEVDAAKAEAAAARLALSTSIASAYADLASLHALRDTAIDAVAVRDQSLTLITERRSNGLENQGAADRAEAARATAQANMASIDEAIALRRNAIAALLGEGPDRGMRIGRPAKIRLPTFGLPGDVASDLLGRRPDVIAARWRTEAAASRIKVAKAGFYPSVNLTAFIGLNALGLGSFAEGDSLVGSAGPAINLPIFKGGQLRGRYREAEADYDIAVAQYDAAVVRALREVADAAVSGKALTVRLDRAGDAERHSAAALQVATNRYRGGLAPYLDVLTAEDVAIASRRAVTELEARGFMLDVALVRALGGGFRQINRNAS